MYRDRCLSVHQVNVTSCALNTLCTSIKAFTADAIARAHLQCWTQLNVTASRVLNAFTIISFISTNIESIVVATENYDCNLLQ